MCRLILYQITRGVSPKLFVRPLMPRIDAETGEENNIERVAALLDLAVTMRDWKL
jgi:hypothetical protein